MGDKTGFLRLGHISEVPISTVQTPPVPASTRGTVSSSTEKVVAVQRSPLSDC